MAKAMSGVGKGLIQHGDPGAYLGHFRSQKVMSKGHNQGAPNNAVLSAGVAGGNMPAMPSSAMSPVGGAPLPAAGPGSPNPYQGRPFGTAPGAPIRPTFDPNINPVAAARQSGLRGSALAPARAQRRANVAAGIGPRQRAAGLRSARQAARGARTGAALAGGLPAPVVQRAQNLNQATAAKQTARQDLRSARQERRSARQQMRAARRGR